MGMPFGALTRSLGRIETMYIFIEMRSDAISRCTGGGADEDAPAFTSVL